MLPGGVAVPAENEPANTNQRKTPNLRLSPLLAFTRRVLTSTSWRSGEHEVYMWNEMVNPKIQWMDVCDWSVNEHINAALPSLTFTRKSTQHLLVWMGINSAWKCVVLWELRDIITKIFNSQSIYLTYLSHTNTDCISLISCVTNSVLSRPFDGDEPVTVAELLAPGPVRRWNFLRGTGKNSGQHGTGESREGLFDISSRAHSHHPQACKGARSRALQGRLSLWPLGQSKTTSGTWKLDITYLIIPKGLIKINIDTFKTAVYEALGGCCCFGARPTCLQCTTLSNWNSHLDASLAFSARINGSMNRWEGINRLCPWRDGLVRAHTHTRTRPKIFTIDMWVTLSIRPATAAGWGERNDFVSEKICYWI